METNQYRLLPAIDALVQHLEPAGATHARVVEVARALLTEARQAISSGGTAPSLEALRAELEQRLAAAMRPSLRPVINASGVILQTNLGRAPLSERAIAAMNIAARGYSNLEYDLDEGARGSRHDHVREMVRRATGAEDGLAVNNNASALFMVLSVLGAGREVVISRGEAVEIGGGFRIPDVLRSSGATLVEVGTTNRTYARDYEAAITEDTAILLKVHASNFKVVGFTATASHAELARVADQHDVLLVDDLGSGCLLDTTQWGMAKEPTVQDSLAAGCDLALFSGDKLLGGPQCGIIAGRADIIEKLRRHPLARALRIDKLTIAALNATLQAYVDGTAATEIPVWQMVSLPLTEVRQRAERWASLAGEQGAVVEGRSMVGGGSLPGEGVPTWCAAINAAAGAHTLAAELRAGERPIVGRLESGRLLLDPRTVSPDDDDAVGAALVHALGPVSNQR